MSAKMEQPTPTEQHLEAYRNLAANLADAWFTMKMTDREEMERMGREVLDRMFTDVFRSLLQAEMHRIDPLKTTAQEAVRRWIDQGNLERAAIEQSAVTEEIASFFSGRDVKRFVSQPIAELRAMVYRLRRQGLTWNEIGARLGIGVTRAGQLHQVAEGRVRLLRQELAMYEAIDKEKGEPT